MDALISKDVVPFLAEQPFLIENRGVIEDVFSDLAADFPQRLTVVDGEEVATAEALQFDDAGNLSMAARQWLTNHAVGTQHGYDRQVDRDRKLAIPLGDLKYMSHLSKINCGEYNFVEGGQPDVDLDEKNILVGGGFPHLNAGRLRAALNGNYNQLWDVNNVSMLAGQRRRWNDNENEASSDIVFGRTAHFSNFDSFSGHDTSLLDRWSRLSELAREEQLKPEGPEWTQRYATEAEMGRLALELAMLRMDEEIFDWNDYSVVEHRDEESDSEQQIDGHSIPSRGVRAWEYITKDGKSFFVINGKAVPRDNGGEPRPTSASVIREAYNYLEVSLRNNQSIVAFGAPHIRGAYHTVSELIDISKGQIQPVHLSIDRWEFHEPPVTGIASIPGMDTIDRTLRSRVG